MGHKHKRRGHAHHRHGRRSSESDSSYSSDTGQRGGYDLMEAPDPSTTGTSSTSSSAPEEQHHHKHHHHQRKHHHQHHHHKHHHKQHHLKYADVDEIVLDPSKAIEGGGERKSVFISSSKPSAEDLDGSQITARPPRKMTSWANLLDRVEHPFGTFEDALKAVGMFGRYQVFTCVVVMYASILWAGNYSFMTLGRLEPDWQCHDEGWNHTIYRAPTESDPVACFMIKNCTNLTRINNPFYSLTEEWTLVCDQQDVPDLLFMIYLFGRIAGSIVGGHVGDAFGRKKGFFTAQFMLMISGVMAIACTGWKSFAVLQAINGFFFGIIEVTALTLMMEYTDSKYRLIPNAMFQWCFGYMVLGLIAALTKDWRYYIIFVNLVCSPLLVGYLLILESPRWLISKGYLFRAAEALSDIASDRWNNKNVAIVEEDLAEIHRDEKVGYYWFIHLFSTRKLALQSFLQMISVFTYSLVDSTYVFNVDAVPGGPFMHFFYYGLLRVWVAPVVIYLDWKIPRFGRKALFLSSLILTGLSFLATTVLLLLGVAKENPAVVVCTIIGTTINSSAFYMAIIQITTAAYPTVMRAIAFGTLNIWIDIGTIVSTLVITPLSRTWAPYPYVISLGAVCVTILLAAFLQPETKGKKLPDSYSDVN